MRAHVPSYELKTVESLGQALELLAREPGVWKPFAGGTDIMVLFEAGKLAHKQFFSLWNLNELRGIDVDDGHVNIGALTTYSEIREHDLIRSNFPMLCQAAAETGAIAIQNRGTIGGNIANASPAADTPPALLVYDAEVELVSKRGSRWVKYGTFHTGYKSTVMKPDELIKSVRLPRTHDEARHYYRKVGTRKAQAISKVCFAAHATHAGGALTDIRIALGSVAPTAIRCPKTEAFLNGKTVDAALVKAARNTLATEIAPIDDIRSSSAYRRNVTLNLLEDFLSHVELDQ